jgi:hypothetical protein
VSEKMEHDNEIARITISIAIVATFLTLILNINNLISKSSPFLSIFKWIVYIHFIIICLMFFLYLLFKARDLKYYKEESDNRASDYSVVIQYVLLWVFKPKSVKYSRKELRNRFNNKSLDTYKFFYDEGIRQSFFFPMNLGYYFLITQVPGWLTGFLSLDNFWINIISIIVIVIFLLLISLLMNVLRFMITGEQ